MPQQTLTPRVNASSALRDAGVDVIDVSEYTGQTTVFDRPAAPEVSLRPSLGFPEILGGRVKSLHPKIHGGLLADPTTPSHLEDLAKHDIGSIDLVACNLYPFGLNPGIANIDIGGQTMLRAGAKNHIACTVLSSPAQYGSVMEAMGAAEPGQPPTVPLALREGLAAEAFAHTAQYDAEIAAWMAREKGLREKGSIPENFFGVAQKHQGPNGPGPRPSPALNCGP